MAVTGVNMQPEVIALGGATEDYYNLVDGAAISEGDLVRINTSGAVVLAALDTDTAGAVHGIALEDGTTAGVAMKVLKFAPDTLIKIQTADSADPATNFVVGVSYELDTATTKKWAVKATSTKGIAKVVSYAGTAQPFTIARGGWDETTTTDNNSLIVRFVSSVLDGAAA